MRKWAMVALCVAAMVGCGPGALGDGGDELGATESDGGESGDGATTGTSSDGDATTDESESGTETTTTTTSSSSSDTGPDCPTSAHNLTITDDTDPAELACLVTATGQLRILDTSLSDLSLLPSLEKADRLILDNNPNLSSLAGLSKLETVDWLSIRASNQLDSLAGLDSITTIDKLSIGGSVDELGLPPGVEMSSLSLASWSSPDLAALEGFAPAPGPLVVSIESPTLTDLGGLSACCTEVELGLEIWEAPALDDLGGLEGFDSLAKLELRGVPALTSFAGLGATQIGRFEIVGDECSWEDMNWSLESMAGLEEVTAIDLLTVRAVPSLLSLDGLPTTMTVDSADIYNNPLLPQAEAEAWAAAVMPGSQFICSNGNGGQPFCYPKPPGICPQ